MTYYARVQGEKVLGVGQCKVSGEDIICVEISEEIYDDFETDKYLYKNEEIVLNPEFEAIKEEKEQERINSLTMTSLDLIEYVNKAGISYEDIQAFLLANPMINLKLTCCKDCYCGVVRQLAPITIGGVTLTDELIVYAFKKQNGEEVEGLV